MGQDMTMDRKSGSIRSTGKIGQKRNVFGRFDAFGKGASLLAGNGKKALNEKPWRIAA